MKPNNNAINAFKALDNIKTNAITKTMTKRQVNKAMRKNTKLNLAKTNAIRDIAQTKSKVWANTVKSLGSSIAAVEGVNSLTNKNSYRGSLDAWMRNISGNPDTSTGANGETQTGSTGEFGG